MDLAYLIKESELLDHTSSLGFVLQAGEAEWNHQLHGPWTSSSQVLAQRADQVHRLRAHPEVLAEFNIILKSLKESETLLLSHVSSETSTSAEAQIFFTGTHTKVLNHIPFLIMLIVLFKIWIAPLLALMTPFLLCIMPYIIMTSVMDMNIPWDTYVLLMKQMIFGIQTGEAWSMKHYVQAAWTLASIGQGMVMPFITAYHTANLDTTIVRRGEALQTLIRNGSYLLRKIQSLGVMLEPFQQFPIIPEDVREAAAWMESEPLGMKQLWKMLGRISVFTMLASDPSWHPVSWVSSSNSFQLSEFHDLAIKKTKAKVSTLSKLGHSLLTGPNRGGKSSCLRAILQQVLLGQTFGFTKGATGSWRPFGLVFTRLKSRDSAGKESLFEMEVRMASKILRTAKVSNQTSLVLIDELFHSTNPPDAETSAKLFLRDLWKLPYCKSIISTHIFSLCELVSGKIQPLCCPAAMLPSGKLQYSYTLQAGICRVSSVQEVLEEAGMCA
jgi:hypothetical protein